MAVQFNLLPDVKLEFDRVKRTQRRVVLLSSLVTAVLLGVFILSFFSVNVLQKKLMNDANNDMNNYSDQLKKIPDLSKILTIQNQLQSLPSLHQQKHITSRSFTYLIQLTPTNVHISRLTLDTSTSTITFLGTSDTVEAINTFVDTLKFTKYSVDSGDKKDAISSVVLDNICRDQKQARYTISAVYDTALFDSTQNVVLSVPQQLTTRSITDAPTTGSALFNGQEVQKPKANGNGGTQ
jgi:Tfp pilus assembly protein PilN